MTPYALTTEQRSEPLGLDDTRPRLSWKPSSDRRGAAQTTGVSRPGTSTSTGTTLTCSGATAPATPTATGCKSTPTPRAGSTALLDIPTPDPDSVRENDEPVSAVPSATGRPCG